MRILVKPLQIGKGARMFIIESTESQKECGMVDGAIKLQIHHCACRIDTSRRLWCMLARTIGTPDGRANA